MAVHVLPAQRGLTLDAVVTDAVLDAACAWLCQQRRDWPAAADVWRLRQRWPEEKERRRAELLAGTDAVGLLRRAEHLSLCRGVWQKPSRLYRAGGWRSTICVRSGAALPQAGVPQRLDGILHSVPGAKSRVLYMP